MMDGETRRALIEEYRGGPGPTAQILDFLVPAQWLRAGTHTESGPYSVEDWLGIYARHAHEHAEQIDRV